MTLYNHENNQISKQNVMALNLKLLKITGVVIPQSFKISICKMIIHYLCILGTYVVYFPVLVGQLMAVYHFWGKIDIFTKTLFNTLGGLMCYLEAIYGKLNSKNIENLFVTFQNKVLPKMALVGLEEKNNEIYRRATKKAHRLTWTVMIIIDLMMIFWMPAPIINRLRQERKNETVYDPDDDSRWLDFCFVTWFPYDITISPYYEVMYVLQVLMFVIATGYMKSLDITMISMLVHISAQFEILYTAINDMDSILASASRKPKQFRQEISTRGNNKRAESTSNDLNPQNKSRFSVSEDDKEINNDGISTMEDTPEMREYFVNVIEYHQSILSFVKDMDHVAGPLIIICFFISQFLGCVMSFQMALEWNQGNKDTTFLKFLFGFLGATCIPFIYCWYGTAVMQNSLLVHKAAFECQWYRRSETFKRQLILVIMRAQKPVCVSGRQFYKLSLHTFGEMMNTMYAYFTLLKNLYED